MPARQSRNPVQVPSLVVTDQVGTAFTGTGFDQLLYAVRAQATLVGGGLLTGDSTGVSWSQRIMVISSGRGADLATSGYFEITMPPDGTVVPGYGGATSVTVAGGKVPLTTHQALYYELPLGEPPPVGPQSASIAENFRVVTYTADVKVPARWVRIVYKASQTSTDNQGPAFYWGIDQTDAIDPYWHGYLTASPTAVAANVLATIATWVADGSPNSSGITHSSGIFTVPKAGRYRIRAQIWWGGVTGATGNRLAQIIQVSPLFAIQSNTVAASASTSYPAINHLDKTVRLDAGEQFYLRFQHTDAVNRAPTGTTSDITFVQITWVGP